MNIQTETFLDREEVECSNQIGNDRLALALEVVTRKVGHNYAAVKIANEKLEQADKKIKILSFEVMILRKKRKIDDLRFRELSDKHMHLQSVMNKFDYFKIQDYIHVLEDLVQEKLIEMNKKYKM